MLRPSATLALALLLATSAARAQSPLDEGRLAVEARDWPRARAALAPLVRADSSREAADAEYLLGVIDDEGFRFAGALEHYRAALARDSGSRYAARAWARVEELEQHAEGGFAPLARLERVRRDPALADDPRVIADLEREAARFPPGPVRAETRLLVGQAYAGRLQRPRDAARAFHALAADAAAPASLRALAASRLLEVRHQLGEAPAAVRELETLRADPGTVRAAKRLRLRTVLHHTAHVLLPVLAAAGLWSLVRAARRRMLRAVARAWLRPLPLVWLVLGTAGSAALARYDGGDPHVFGAMGAGALGAYLVASAWSVTGSTRPVPRVLRALLCAAGVLAASFLAMEALDERMLVDFSL